MALAHAPHRRVAVSTRQRAPEDRATAYARNLARGSAARLRRVAARAGGESGMALASALVDMIMNHEAPATWPIAEMIDLLDNDNENASRDRQADRLLASLRRIEADIDLWSDVLDSDVG